MPDLKLTQPLYVVSLITTALIVLSLGPVSETTSDKHAKNDIKLNFSGEKEKLASMILGYELLCFNSAKLPKDINNKKVAPSTYTNGLSDAIYAYDELLKENGHMIRAGVRGFAPRPTENLSISQTTLAKGPLKSPDLSKPENVLPRLYKSISEQNKKRYAARVN